MTSPKLQTAISKTAAQNRWIAYNKAKGQYSSAQEHATPEAFWVDKNQCRYMDSNGQVQNPTMQPCAEGISAVKAIAIAQSQGQKIYTINESNRDTALPKLPIGGEVGAEIRNAINAGKEVTFHEARINEHGWSGYGYSIVDPETGAGAYLIEGKGNGGFLLTYLLKLAGAIIGTYLKFVKAATILTLGVAGIFGLVTILVGCFFELDNSQILYINSAALLAISIAALFFTLPMSIFAFPLIGVLLALFGAARDPRGNGMACTLIPGF